MPAFTGMTRFSNPLAQVSMKTRQTSTSAHAFTLVEMIVVIVVLSIIMAVALPRLTGSGNREFQQAADEVANLLMMYAQRDMLSPRPVGLYYNESIGQLLVMVNDEDDRFPGRAAEWYPDPTVPPVRLPDIVDPTSILVIADDELVDIRRWPLSHVPGQPRPTIEIQLATDDRAQTTSLYLPHYALAPRRSDDDHDMMTLRYPIDLDQAGRSREAW
jgi:prepilin-type N-terminal cleavage/methylation domain-containing protein